MSSFYRAAASPGDLGFTAHDTSLEECVLVSWYQWFREAATDPAAA